MRTMTAQERSKHMNDLMVALIDEGNPKQAEKLCNELITDRLVRERLGEVEDL